MEKPSEKYVVDSVRDFLQEGQPEEIKPPPQPAVSSAAQLLKFGKRRHFALGMILLSIFVLLLSFVFPKEDIYFWASCSALLMLVGAWQWDKAKRDLVVAARTGSTPAGGKPTVKLRSVDGDTT